MLMYSNFNKLSQAISPNKSLYINPISHNHPPPNKYSMAFFPAQSRLELCSGRNYYQYDGTLNNIIKTLHHPIINQ